MKEKLKNFFLKLFKNKIFWICFSIVLLALLITWMCLAPGDKSSASTVSDAISRLFGLFIVLSLGLVIGRITIKGVSFGSAGVFLMALLIGVVFSLPQLKSNPFWAKFMLDMDVDKAVYADAFGNLGLTLFASAVGFIAGPTFFRDFKSNAKIYIIMGIAVTAIGVGLTAIIGLLPNIGPIYAAGIFSGAITSTPALAAAQEVIGSAGASSAWLSIGYAITYPLGVIGVVLFIQLMPKILKVDMAKERGRLIASALDKEIDAEIEQNAEEKRGGGLTTGDNYFEIDSYGIAPFAIAAFVGLLLGTIQIPLTPSGYNGICFNLGTTGGCLISCIVFAHFGHVGKMSFKVPEATSKTFREFGLIVFLIGIGVSGGMQLVNEMSKGGIDGMKIVLGIALGVIITFIPMIGGYFMGKYLFKLPILNNLGSITGSMTSTPALGALIQMSKTDDVATAYASAFPIATILTAIGMNLYLSIAM